MAHKPESFIQLHGWQCTSSRLQDAHQLKVGCQLEATNFYLRRYEEAARQFELVLHECGDKSDADTTALRIDTLYKLGELRHFYLNDQDGALRTYRRITEISPAGKLAFETRKKS